MINDKPTCVTIFFFKIVLFIRDHNFNTRLQLHRIPRQKVVYMSRMLRREKETYEVNYTCLKAK